MKTKRKRAVRGRSIARRLNAALTRRSFFKTVLIDLLSALLILATWCLTVEGSYGGNLLSVSDRRFDGESDVLWNTKRFVDDVGRYWDQLIHDIKPEEEITLPFDGIYYQFRLPSGVAVDRTDVIYDETSPTVEEGTEDPSTGETVEESNPLHSHGELESLPISEDELGYSFTVNGEEVPHVQAGTGATEIWQLDDVNTAPIRPDASAVIPSVMLSPEVLADGSQIVRVDASVILSLVTGGLLLLFLCQIIWAILRSLLGGGLIKQYLRPIDDMALMAEQLSSEAHTPRAAQPRETLDGETDGGDAVVDMQDVAHLADALDEIDDSRARIQMSAPELSGLEAALNNMLKRLEESRRKQIRFVDDASHELRTPIAVIQGYANMLDRWGKEDPAIRDEAIEAIKNEAEHVKTLLDQLLFLARGEMDRHVLEQKPLCVAPILTEVMEESMMLDGRHHYRLELPAVSEESGEMAEREMRIMGDGAMIKQCIRILCDNAVRYTPENGSIDLRAGERVGLEANGDVRREIFIEVADTGCGISPRELPRIFDRFYRGENARGDNTTGSGLGLSIARWIVEQHHGRIEAVSSPGIGTKMTILLPAYEE